MPNKQKIARRKTKPKEATAAAATVMMIND
jgi:hypothetical protein